MEYKTLGELAGRADIRLEPAFMSMPMTKHERLERWAMLLARYPERQLSSVEEIEYGTVRSNRRSGRTIGTVGGVRGPGFARAGSGERPGGRCRPLLRAVALGIHQLVCSCHYGRRMSAGAAALRVRAIARRAQPRTIARAGWIAAGVSAAAVAVVVAIL